MKHPQKWRETVDPFSLSYHNFSVLEILGYPHAGNDVFHVRGRDRETETEAYIKVARQASADLENERNTIGTLQHPLAPQILDFDELHHRFLVTKAKSGERLSTILGSNENLESLNYLFAYGKTLGELHRSKGTFPAVKERRFFRMPSEAYCNQHGFQDVRQFLTEREPQVINRCFCHGDFHYANILWQDKKISGILDFELSGIGNKEFDIAWALICRPGQTFLKQKKEIDLFLDGYCSVNDCCWADVQYYMVLIYLHFYQIGADTPGYQDYIRSVFQAYGV